MVEIKRLSESDPILLDQLAEIYEAAYRQEPLYAEKGKGRIKRYLRWLLKHARGAFWIAWENQRPVGFLALEELEPVPEVHEIVVAPDWQGRGLSEKLMEKALAYLKEKGYEKVALWVGEYNFRAQRFYRKFGFEINDKVGIWLRMEKALQEKERASSQSTRKAVSTSESKIVSSGV